MEYINGEFIMKGCEEAEAIHTVAEAASYIHKVGFIPLFSNIIPGFSLEEHTEPSQWWSDDPETDPWIWRQTLSSNPEIAYGKFFGRNAGFISKEWFPDFANYRRNGYDFDALFEDELASYRSRKIMDVFELDDEAAGRQVMSSEVKSLAGFSKDGGEKNFEGVITDLQMQTYLIMGDFQQKKNRNGQPFGWHIAVMETPETKWGREFVSSCYSENPVISWQRITEKMKSAFQNARDKEITKMLGIKYPGTENKSIMPEKEKKISKPRTIRPQELPWPENLMTEIGLEKVFPETGKYAALTEDQMAGLTYAMGGLKEKEQNVIRLRYEQHRTLRAAGELLGVTGNRVRQVAAHAVRKLIHPTRLCYFRDGYQATLDMQARLKEETRQALKAGDRMQILGAIHIYDAYLSARSTNCLVRAGYKTLGDVVKSMEEDSVSITHIRNIGGQVLREVIEKLEEYGVDCSELRKI